MFGFEKYLVDTLYVINPFRVHSLDTHFTFPSREGSIFVSKSSIQFQIAPDQGFSILLFLKTE